MTMTGSVNMAVAGVSTRHLHGHAIKRRSRALIGNFEENILNNRLEPIRTVDGYMAEVRASCNSIQPNPMRSGVRVSFYSIDESFPYLGQVFIGRRGYKIPKRGTLQVTLFNPNGTLVKLFLLHYDLTDMPPDSQTFLRQKTLFVAAPVKCLESTKSEDHSNRNIIDGDAKPSQQENHRSTIITSSTTQRVILSNKQAIKKSPLETNSPQLPPSNQQQQQQPCRIKYLIQLNIVSSKSGRIYLNKDLRIFISKKVDMETASQLNKQDYELKAFDEMPRNPKYFSR